MSCFIVAGQDILKGGPKAVELTSAMLEWLDIVVECAAREEEGDPQTGLLAQAVDGKFCKLTGREIR